MQFIQGEEVVVKEGPLRGLTGRILSNGETTIVVAFDVLSQGVRVQLPRSLLEHAHRKVPPQLVIGVDEISKGLVAELGKRPEDLRSVHPRKFEELISELLRDRGYRTTLTPPSKDGGRDIFAVLETPLGSSLTLVECKRYAKHRKIGVDLIQRLLWVAQEDRASCSLMVTTSHFTSGAREIERRLKWTLRLSDFDEVSRWLQQYGSWRSGLIGGVWSPANDSLKKAV